MDKEQQHRCCISSDRLNQLRRIVDTAVLEHKVFLIKGDTDIRTALLNRGWLEKVEIRRPISPITIKNGNQLSMDDICANLPPKEDSDSLASYIEKCEKIIISRLLKSHKVDFYWNLHRDCLEWRRCLDKNMLVYRFYRSLFSTKTGLCRLLQQMSLKKPRNSYIRFPRCYTNNPDQSIYFKEDYRMTACISLLKWFIEKTRNESIFKICTPEGIVPITSITFAIDRCNDYINMKKQLDIKKDPNKDWNQEWEEFIKNFQLLIYKNQLLVENKAGTIYSLYKLETVAQEVLQNIRPHWPQFELDGFHNIWIMKRGNKCRGYDIKLITDASDFLSVTYNKLKYVVQKYIERPLLIFKTKFDIRQWFLVTSVKPLTVWMYRDSYLRFSTRSFNLNDFHESIHLTNNAIQCKYQVAKERDKALPIDNMWDNHIFKAYLRKIGHDEKWDMVIYPGMKEIIVAVVLASQDTMDHRPNTFELYGADFMIAENFTPWLVEINCCSAMEPTTSVTARMCPQCCEDIIKVVVDRRTKPNAATGLFELVYPKKLS